MSPQNNEPAPTEPDWATYVDNLLRAPASQERRRDKPQPAEVAPRAPAKNRPEPLSWVDYVDELGQIDP